MVAHDAFSIMCFARENKKIFAEHFKDRSVAFLSTPPPETITVNPVLRDDLSWPRKYNFFPSLASSWCFVRE